jgi:hypothetical protein
LDHTDPCHNLCLKLVVGNDLLDLAVPGCEVFPEFFLCESVLEDLVNLLLVAAVNQILVDDLPHLVAVLEVGLHLLQHWKPNRKHIVGFVEHLAGCHIFKAVLEQKAEISGQLVHVFTDSFKAFVWVHKYALGGAEEREVILFLFLFLLLLGQIVLCYLADCFLDFVYLIRVFLFAF